MTPFLRFSSACGVICGVLTAIPGGIEAFTGETAVTSSILGLSPVLAPPFLTALYLAQRARAGRFGLVAYAVNIIGLNLFVGAAFTLNLALFYLDDHVLTDLLRGPTKVALLGSGAVLAVGSILFAISMFQAKAYPGIPVWIYGIALPVFVLVAPLPDNVLTSSLHVLTGIALIWLGSSLWSQADPQPMAHAERATTPSHR